MNGYSTPRPISNKDNIADFDNGEPSLDDWLRRRAFTNQTAGASRCFVTCREDRVVGYYALATGSVRRSDASTRVAHGMPEPIPVILLERLAVDRTEQGKDARSFVRDYR